MNPQLKLALCRILWLVGIVPVFILSMLFMFITFAALLLSLAVYWLAGVADPLNAETPGPDWLYDLYDIMFENWNKLLKP